MNSHLTTGSKVSSRCAGAVVTEKVRSTAGRLSDQPSAVHLGAAQLTIRADQYLPGIDLLDGHLATCRPTRSATSAAVHLVLLTGTLSPLLSYIKEGNKIASVDKLWLSAVDYRQPVLHPPPDGIGMEIEEFRYLDN